VRVRIASSIIVVSALSWIWSCAPFSAAAVERGGPDSATADASIDGTSGSNDGGKSAGGTTLPAGAKRWSEGTGSNNHAYLVVVAPTGLAWNDAKAAAEKLGGKLASITSPEENAFVWKLVEATKGAIYDQAGVANHIGPWLGGYQDPAGIDAAVGWKWVDDEMWSYAPWAFGEPNDKGQGEDYVQYYSFASGPTSGWADGPGVEPPHAYVVEFP
jgi:hypothetical protein